MISPPLRAASASRPSTPYRRGVSAPHLVGREGVTLIAVSGLDMAAWDALAKAAGLPLAEYLGGTVGPVPAYNSNGLWLTARIALARKRRRLSPKAASRR